MPELSNYTETVTFSHEDNLLQGVIYKPDGITSFPIVILIPGHGIRANTIDAHGTFDYLLPMIGHYLVEQGIGVFHYDRPGTGGSTGDWRFQTLYDRADEVLTASRFLQDHIKPTQIGVLGHSNGGWVAPIVGNQSEQIKFAVIVSGPSVSLGRQCLSALHILLRQNQVEISDQVHIMSYAETVVMLYRLLIQGQRSEFLKIKSRLKKEQVPHAHLLEDFALPIPTWAERDEILKSMDAMVDYDAVTALTDLQCPTLAVFGEADGAFDATENAILCRYALSIGGHPDSNVHILAGANHRMQIRMADDTLKIEPNFQRIVTEWIKQRG